MKRSKSGLPVGGHHQRGHVLYLAGEIRRDFIRRSSQAWSAAEAGRSGPDHLSARRWAASAYDFNCAPLSRSRHESPS